MKDVQDYVNRVRRAHATVEGNEAATRSSLIGPLFTILGYDLADPAECVPEFKADFGKDRSVKPVDWAFYLNGRPAFIVEAKEAGRQLAGYDEQLGDYFAKVQPDVKLGILTNGVMWRFFTDVDYDHIMDKEPFATWDVLTDEQPPLELLTLLQKAHPFNSELIRDFAKKRRAHNVLIKELTRLLEPAPEFTKLVIENIEVRNATPKVLDYWKPVVAGAIEEWARQRTLTSVLAKRAVDQTATTSAGSDDDERPERYVLRKRFWTGLLGRPTARGTRHAGNAPGEANWIGAGTGVRGVHFNYVIRQDEGQVELYVDRGVKEIEENKRIFDRLHGRRKEIEKAFGGELSWQRLDEKHACRIAHVLPGGYRNPEAGWPGIQDAMIEAMGRLDRALGPFLAELKESAGLESA